LACIQVHAARDTSRKADLTPPDTIRDQEDRPHTARDTINRPHAARDTISDQEGRPHTARDTIRKAVVYIFKQCIQKAMIHVREQLQ
jgi:hypothetical protein